MSDEVKIESGLQLITRLIDRPSFESLDSKLFFDGLQNTDVVEIRGTDDSGVSHLLNKLVSKCILPLDTNGLNMEVLFLNTDNQLEVSKLYKIIYQEIKDIKGPVNVDKAAIDTLKNFKILSCYDHYQLLVSLNSLDNLLLKNKKIGLIIIDSISAYYWQKKGETYNSYLMKFLKVIKKVAADFKVAVIFTKQFDFISKKQTLEQNEGKKLLRYKISLCKDESLQKLICNVKSGQDEKQLFYEIKESIFNWLEVRIN